MDINCFCFLTRADPVCAIGQSNENPVAESRKCNTYFSKAIFFKRLDNLTVQVKSERINTTDYCLCNNCKPMKTEEDSVCCQEIKVFQERFQGMIWVMKYLNVIYNLTDLCCICSHPLVKSILDKEILR